MDRILEISKENFNEKEFNKTLLNICIENYDIYIIYPNFSRDIIKLNNCEGVDNNFVGYLIFDSIKTHIVNICISKEYQRQGYGINFLDFLKNFKVTLHVRVSNIKAINLYKKMGFNIINTILNYYNYTNNNEDAYLMIST